MGKIARGVNKINLPCCMAIVAILLSHHIRSMYDVCRESNFSFYEKKKFSPFDECSWFVCLRRQNKQKKFRLSVWLSVCLSVCLDVWLYVRTWTFHVDTITFEGVSGSKQNLVGVFNVWNVGLILKSKIKSWSWSKSWSWTEFWFSKNLCGATPNLVDIFSI